MPAAATVQKNDLPEILQVHEGQYLVENQKGKSFVVVSINDQGYFCGCPGFAKSAKKNPSAATCKHIEAAMSGLSNGGVENVSGRSSGKPQLDPRFIIRIDGQEFVKFQGLLDLGHQKGISQIEVEPMQLPSDSNGHLAVCKATIIGKGGESFTDIGDSSPQNTNSRVSKHLLRMASTRAIARALRAFTNVGLTALEEADLDDLSGNGGRKNESKTKTRSTRNQKNNQGVSPKTRTANEPPQNMPAERNRSVETNAAKGEAASQNRLNDKQQPKMSEAQRKAILNLGHRRGIPMDRLENMAQETFGVQLESMTSKDAAYFIRHLQQQAA